MLLALLFCVERTHVWERIRSYEWKYDIDDFVCTCSSRSLCGLLDYSE